MRATGIAGLAAPSLQTHSSPNGPSSQRDALAHQMTLTFVPLLQIQRDLYALPRNMERFSAYIETMTDASTNDLKLPLVAMNPMGKEHVATLLDEWMALGADDIGARAVADAEIRLQDVSGEFRVGLVIADDLKGGWTNRCTYEFADRFATKALHRRGWLTGMLWTSESPSADAAREAVATSVYRASYIEQHGYAHSLREMIAQEAYAMANAKCTGPSLDADDLAYTREAIAAHLDAIDHATIIACLFGDNAAAELGHARRGFSDRAGLALARAGWNQGSATA